MYFRESAANLFLGQERNLHYVVHIEVFLAKAFSEGVGEEDDDMLQVTRFLVVGTTLTPG